MLPSATFPLTEGAERLGVSVDWYMRQLRARKLPGHKLGRKWRLTEDDLAEALRLTAMPALAPRPDPAGLTAGSRRRLERRGLNGTTGFEG
ncbi:helix-turn-helix domain-containing protein [Rhodococcus kroppenstedtii]|nr:helix-turn-helix domain-containing protein [Rhodococcus kroppenstedtii]